MFFSIPWKTVQLRTTLKSQKTQCGQHFKSVTEAENNNFFFWLGELRSCEYYRVRRPHLKIFGDGCKTCLGAAQTLGRVWGGPQ